MVKQLIEQILCENEQPDFGEWFDQLFKTRTNLQYTREAFISLVYPYILKHLEGTIYGNLDMNTARFTEMEKTEISVFSHNHINKNGLIVYGIRLILMNPRNSPPALFVVLTLSLAIRNQMVHKQSMNFGYDGDTLDNILNFKQDLATEAKKTQLKFNAAIQTEIKNIMNDHGSADDKLMVKQLAGGSNTISEILKTMMR